VSAVEVVAEGGFTAVPRGSQSGSLEPATTSGTNSPPLTTGLIRGKCPSLNASGEAYYVAFRERPTEGFWPDSGPHLTLDDAMKAATDRLPTPVEWRSVVS
jgi:hypothetical protein